MSKPKSTTSPGSGAKASLRDTIASEQAQTARAYGILVEAQSGAGKLPSWQDCMQQAATPATTKTEH